MDAKGCSEDNDKVKAAFLLGGTAEQARRTMPRPRLALRRLQIAGNWRRGWDNPSA